MQQWLSSANRNVIFGPMLNSPVCGDLQVENVLWALLFVYIYMVTNKVPL